MTQTKTSFPDRFSLKDPRLQAEIPMHFRAQHRPLMGSKFGFSPGQPAFQIPFSNQQLEMRRSPHNAPLALADLSPPTNW
jgi:hypothetical protein